MGEITRKELSPKLLDELLTSGGMYAANVTKKDVSNAIGNQTIARGDASFAEGNKTLAQTHNTHAEGYMTIAAYGATYEILRFTENTLTLDSTADLKVDTEILIKRQSSDSSQIVKIISVAGNVITLPSGLNLDSNCTCVIRPSMTTKDLSTHAEGIYTLASGSGAHAEGSNTLAVGDQSHAEGSDTFAIGNNSHAQGSSTFALGDTAHAEGLATNANGSYSHAEGRESTATGNVSHAGGFGTNALSFASTAIGRYNKAITGNPSSIVSTDDAFVIGSGTSATSLANAFRVTFDGKVYGKAAFNSTGADYAEFFEWLDGNVDNEDRVGYFVSISNGKIQKATSTTKYILGIVSINPSVVGDSHQDDWNDKYVTDNWGRIQYEWVEIIEEKIVDGKIVRETRQDYIPVLNPEWNNEEKYIPREKRKEWSPIGIMGKLLVHDDGTCEVNGYCKPNVDGIATTSEDGYIVLERITENIVKVFLK